MENINKQLNHNDEMFKKAKRELLMQKKAEGQMRKENNEAKMKEVNERVKHWSEIQKQLKERRQEMEKAKNKLEEEEQERARRQA